MKQFTLKLINRSNAVDFNETEVNTYEDFCDPEREDLMELRVGQQITLDDKSIVTRIA